jgi:protein-L-isoaspartate(D-aspartate) O-methyltransferase
MVNYALARHNMVESQVRPNGITDRRIIDAMATVKRENFVPTERKSIAYLDEDVLLKQAANSAPRYLIEPMALARIIHVAAIKPSDHVLVIGAGTGYGACVVASLAKSVVGLESEPNLAAEAISNTSEHLNVRIVQGPLAGGQEALGPYDVIVIEGRISEIPPQLFTQLRNYGRIVAAVGATDVSRIVIATLADGCQSSRSSYDVSVAELPGFEIATPAFIF